MVNPVTFQGIRSKLAGLDPWLAAAGRTDARFDLTQIERDIPARVRRFERECRLRLSPVQVVSASDGVYPLEGNTLPVVTTAAQAQFREDTSGGWAITLAERPVRQVQRVRMLYGQRSLWTVPAEWVNADARSGRLHLIAHGGSGTLTLGYPGAMWIGRSLWQGADRPHAVAVDYIAGLEDGWQDSPQWADLHDALEEFCALKVLEDISEVFDPGMLATGFGSDGLNQSLQYDRFERRLNQLRASVEAFKETFIAQESGIIMACL